MSNPTRPAPAAQAASPIHAAAAAPRATSRPGRPLTRPDHPPPSRYTLDASQSPSQTRSESQPGSKAPLLRSQLQHSAEPAAARPVEANFGRGGAKVSPDPNGITDGTDAPSATTTAADGDLEKAEKLQEQERADEERRIDREPPSRYLVRLGRHFLGYRGDKGLPTPVLRPLRHLPPDIETYILTFFGAFPSILIASGLSYGLSRISSDGEDGAFNNIPLTVTSFGASAVLLYAMPEAPVSQPRNTIGGQTISAIVGAVVSQLFALNSRFTNSPPDNSIAGGQSWPSLIPVAEAFAVALATLAMQVTGTVHPPGGATALLASYHRTAGPRYTYILDVFISVCCLTIWALFINNLGRRRFPVYWWSPKKPVNPPAPAAPAATPAPSAPSASAATNADPDRRAVRPGADPASEIRSRSRSSVSTRIDPAADIDLDSIDPRRSRSREDEVFTPLEDTERRWLGRLGEIDEEALSARDEEARREALRWERQRGGGGSVGYR